MLKKLFIFIVVLTLVLSASIIASNTALKPFLKKKILETIEKSFGGEIRISELDIGLLKGVIFLKGLHLKNPDFIPYYSSARCDELILDIDLPMTLLRRNLVFQEIFVRNLAFRVKNEKMPPPASEAAPPPGQNSEKTKASALTTGNLYIKKLLIEGSGFVFANYSAQASPGAIKIIDINGSVDGLSVSLRGDKAVKGTVHLSGCLNSSDDGALKIDGPFSKNNDITNFDLALDINGANLTRFSQYYSQTSFTIVKKAGIDIHSEASCLKNELSANQHVRIYDIKLDELKPTDKDRLFGLPAKTVIEFFRDSDGEVEFDFDVAGTINDPKFDYGPVIEQVLMKALQEKIMARLRQLPREVIKMSERAIKETWEGQDKLEEIEKKIRSIEKKLKNIPED